MAQHVITYLRHAIRTTVVLTVATLLVVGVLITLAGMFVFKALTGQWPIPDPFSFVFGLGMTTGALASYAVGGWTLRRMVHDVPQVFAGVMFATVMSFNLLGRMRGFASRLWNRTPRS